MNERPKGTKIKTPIKSKTGFFVISIDVEMAWGTFDRGGLKKHRRDFKKVRDVIKLLLHTFERYEAPATWAFVGHLFLDSCQPVNGVNHPDMPRPVYHWYKRDWYTEDPGTDILKDPIWYGRDIVDSIRSSKIEHEIACHSFSHVDFGDKGCTREVALAEIQECVRLSAQMGLKMKSFVFPKNNIGHQEVLKKYGFRNFRGRDVLWSDRFKGNLSNKIAQFIEDFFCFTPACHVPAEILPGLWELRGSMIFRSLNGFMEFLPLSKRVHKAVKGLHEAVDNGSVFHLWFHPWHIANGVEKLITVLSEILKEANRLRDLGRLEILPMGEISIKNGLS